MNQVSKPRTTLDLLGQSEVPYQGKFPVVSFRVRRNFPRLPSDLVDRIGQWDVPSISDKVGRMYTMDATIRPLYAPVNRVFGSALTVKVPPGDNIGVKEALRYVKPGDVLVVDGQGFMDWCLGGYRMLALPFAERGLKGLIVNGGYRDIGQACEAGFPLFGKGVAATSGPKRGPAEINVPVCCGGVIVHPGDLVVADEEGVAVIPFDYAAMVADALSASSDEESMDENDLREREDARADYFGLMFKERGGRFIDE